MTFNSMKCVIMYMIQLIYVFIDINYIYCILGDLSLKSGNIVNVQFQMIININETDI